MRCFLIRVQRYNYILNLQTLTVLFLLKYRNSYRRTVFVVIFAPSNTPIKKNEKMKRTIVLSAALWSIIALLTAQNPVDKGLQSINRATAEAQVGFLACDEMEGREAGFRGGDLSAKYLAAWLQSIGVAPLLGNYFQPFNALHKERQLRGGRWQVHPDSIAQLKQGVHQCLSMNNVLGMIPGKRTDEYVIIGAHFDHLGIDPALAGDRIYNGADDNASGVSAVMQIARAFIASGKQPQRNVIFAFWDGEEKGLLGSTYFVQNCSFVSQIKGYLNFDMIGRNNQPDQPRHVVYFYTASHPEFGDWLKKDIEHYQLALEPDYRPWDKPTGGSDNASFARLEIPVIWYHTDGHPDYHQPSDQIESINWEKLVDITKASFLAMWKLAEGTDQKE